MRYLLALLVLFTYCLFCWFCWWRYRRQRPAAVSSSPVRSPNSAQHILVGYASQSGYALRLAVQSVEQLQQAGMSAQVLPLNQISAELLTSHNTLLLVVSTYGEGEAPDNGNRFLARSLSPLPMNSLNHTQVGILALGDSSYQHFCGFGHVLQRELHHRGARFLFDMVEVDKTDESALRHWQYYLGQLSGQSHFSDWIKPDYNQWQLISRKWINPGSPGAPAYHLQLKPLEHEIVENGWQVGDIAEIGPCNSLDKIENFLRTLGRTDVPTHLLATKELPDRVDDYERLRDLEIGLLVDELPEIAHREYSIASIPSEHSLDLLVRQVRGADEQIGLGSGWLTVHALLNHPIRLRIRSNPHFHAPALATPLILIGNGTGIAGLRAHIAHRAQVATKTWLCFGERTSLCDNFFADDLESWQSRGVLTRVDTVFSREARQGEPRYVQDLLLLHATEVRAWVSVGAAIYVCGSLRGMAQAVDENLTHILGESQLETLADQGRYRRDVY